MNVASLELCKELYELSRWEGAHAWYDHGEIKWEQQATWTEPAEFNNTPESDILNDIPAYDLGYLLRKLPRWDADDNCLTLMPGIDEPHWIACYEGFRHQAVADTPEDAACKLSVELFKAGMLGSDLADEGRKPN